MKYLSIKKIISYKWKKVLKNREQTPTTKKTDLLKPHRSEIEDKDLNETIPDLSTIIVIIIIVLFNSNWLYNVHLLYTMCITHR